MMKRSFLAIGIATAAITVGINHAEAATLGNSFYQLTSSSLSWNDAQAEAVSLGGNLVTINSQEEQDFLVSTYSSVNRVWIGFTDQNTEGSFEWVSGESVTYTNWNFGEPNNFGGDEDFVAMNIQDAGGLWFDDGSNATYQGIVEITTTQTVPEPATILGSATALGLGSLLKRQRSKKQKKG